MEQYERYTEAEREQIKDLLQSLYFYSSYWGDSAPINIDDMEETARKLAEVVKAVRKRENR